MKIRIIGAGFSGLCLAYYLTQKKFSVEIFDQAPHAGGLIDTETTEWGLVETAANSLRDSVWVQEICRDLNVPLAEKLPSAKKRFVYTNNGPQRWPLNFSESLQVFSSLPNILLSSPAIRPRSEESLLQWSERVFGKSIGEKLILPAFQGVYGDRTDLLSANLILKKLLKLSDSNLTPKQTSSVAPIKGMKDLVLALQNFLLKSKVSFFLNQHCRFENLDYPQIFCGSLNAAKKWHPTSTQDFAMTQMKSLTSITAFFEPHPKDLHGFGVLFPQTLPNQALGVLFPNSIFVRPQNPSLRSETWFFPQETKIEELLAAREKFFPNAGRLLGAKSFPHQEAFPDYSISLERSLRKRQQLPPNLYLFGNYLGEIGLTGLLHKARLFAEELSQKGSRS